MKYIWDEIKNLNEAQQKMTLVFIVTYMDCIGDWEKAKEKTKEYIKTLDGIS